MSPSLHRSFIRSVIVAIVAMLAFDSGPPAWARDFRINLIPNGSSIGCGACHISPLGGGARNPFGRAVENLVPPGSRMPFWSASLATADSDQDGFTNGEELGDPDGDGTPIPNFTATNPGDPNSKPAVNQPPTVEITSPAPGATFGVSDEIVLIATAADPDGTVASVEFLSGNNSLGVVNAEPYTLLLEWAAGQHTVIARATDDMGATTDSLPVQFTVVDSAPPVVSIIEPTNGTSLVVPVVSLITAEAMAANGAITQVEFFSNGQLLGVVQEAPYSLLVDWTVGEHSVTARATDDSGQSGTSDPITVTVAAAPAPVLGSVTRNGESVEMTWADGGGPFAVESRASLSDPWCAVSMVTTNRGASLPLRSSGEFFRVADLSAQDGPVALTAALSGEFERPEPTGSSGVGTGTFSLRGSTLTFNIQYSGLSGPAIMAHIHGPATMDESASVLIDLEPHNAPGFGVAGTFSGSVILTPDQKAAILSGRTYVNVHTDANRNGEIRGQILPALMVASMRAAHERPPVDAPGSGSGLFLLAGNELTFQIDYQGLTGPAVMAHIHGPADTDTSADVLIDLAPANGGAFGVSGRLSGTVTLSPTQLIALASGRTYVNVHTEANMGGEIRGQILPSVTAIPLSVTLGGAFERPNPVQTSGEGAGLLAVAGDTLLFSIHYSGLSGPAIMAHIHGPADAATATNVMIDLAPFNAGAFGTSGILAGRVTLTAEQKAAVLSGRTYVNVHTEANQGGEIRGQVAPVLMTANLAGSNERPPVESDGVGSGHFLLLGNRLRMNVTYGSLSGPATMAHIHGPADLDTSANVLLDLEPFNLGAFGDSGALAGTATLEAATLSALIDGLTYVNFHTGSHGSGEIRGQIVRPGNP